MENSWLVIRTFNRREMEVGSFLKKNGLPYFIPMTYKEKVVSGEQKPRKVLVPVVHNYVFLQKTMQEDELRRLLTDCMIPLRLMKNKGDENVCEISDREMREFRLLCDPDYVTTPVEFMDAEEAEVKPGREVEVIHGQFAGIRGKLHKSNQKYWFIKTVGGISVMLRISRWYCKPVDGDR